MTRAQAAEALSAALGAAIRAGCGRQEIQDAIEFGYHDAGRLVDAEAAGRGFAHSESEADAEESAQAMAAEYD